MKSLFTSFALAAALTVSLRAVVHANSIDPTSIVPPGAPTSVFVHEPSESGFGKDPFFPRTERFKKEIPKATEERIIEPTIPDAIILKGISVLPDRKLAIINNYTAAQGEEFNLRINGQALKVQCVEIKDKSVVISVNGSTKELPLRAGLQ